MVATESWKCCAWGKPWCTNAARLAQAGARDVCMVPWLLLGFLPAPGASDYRLQLLITCGESQPWHSSAGLGPSGAHCWLSRPVACCLQQAQHSLLHPSKLKSNPEPCSSLQVSEREQQSKLISYSCPEYQNLSSEDTMYLLAPKATRMGG